MFKYPNLRRDHHRQYHLPSLDRRKWLQEDCWAQESLEWHHERDSSANKGANTFVCIWQWHRCSGLLLRRRQAQIEREILRRIGATLRELESGQ
jgi:hypothetical protein